MRASLISVGSQKPPGKTDGLSTLCALWENRGEYNFLFSAKNVSSWEGKQLLFTFADKDAKIIHLLLLK